MFHVGASCIFIDFLNFQGGGAIERGVGSWPGFLQFLGQNAAKTLVKLMFWFFDGCGLL